MIPTYLRKELIVVKSEFWKRFSNFRVTYTEAGLAAHRAPHFEIRIDEVARVPALEYTYMEDGLVVIKINIRLNFVLISKLIPTLRLLVFKLKNYSQRTEKM